ncbi:hypothetical protein Tco_0163999 [Tanacetum coccineum]
MRMSKCLKKRNSQQRVEASDPKIVATRIRKAHAAAKRKAEKNRESEGAGGSEGSSKRRGDNVISPTQTQGDNLVEIPAHDSANTTTRLYEEHHDEHSGVLGNRDGNFDDDVDEEIDIEGPDRNVSDTTERVAIETESIPTAATRPDNGKSIAQEETHMPNPLRKGCFKVREEIESLELILFLADLGSPWPVVLCIGHALFQFESFMVTHHGPAKRVLENYTRLRDFQEKCGLRPKSLCPKRAERLLLGSFFPLNVGGGLYRALSINGLSVPFISRSNGWRQVWLKRGTKRCFTTILIGWNGFDPFSDRRWTAEYERLRMVSSPFKKTQPQEFPESRLVPISSSLLSSMLPEDPKDPPSKKISFCNL